MFSYLAEEWPLSSFSLPSSSLKDDLFSSKTNASKLGEEPNAGGGCKLLHQKYKFTSKRNISKTITPQIQL
jgi:hypothetical protein